MVSESLSFRFGCKPQTDVRVWATNLHLPRPRPAQFCTRSAGPGLQMDYASSLCWITLLEKTL